MEKEKILNVFVEGDDDEYYLEKVIKPILEDYINVSPATLTIKPIQYANIKDRRKNIEFQRIKDSSDEDYIFMIDLQEKYTDESEREIKIKCIRDTIDFIKNRRKELTNLDANKIIIVKREIESWFLAGLNQEVCIELDIQCFDNTDDLTKGKFEKVINKSIQENYDGSEENFIEELVKRYTIETAKAKNQSFKYFVDTFLTKQQFFK